MIVKTKKYIKIHSVCLFIFTIHCIAISKDINIVQLKEQLFLTQSDLDLRGRNEIKGFVDSCVWAGGYYEGNPLDPQGDSSYHVLMDYHGKKVSPLYICYLECIKPYINSSTDVLEIGPGGGAWTKAMLQLKPKSISCLDALCAKHNKFWEQIGRQDNVAYFQVKDFSIDEIKNNSIDIVFSFGTFCHISPLMCYEYFKNLYKKLRPGGHAFIMYADYDKKNEFSLKHNRPDHYAGGHGGNAELLFLKHEQDTNQFMPTWYHLGIDRMGDILKELGYEVIASDMNINDRDPIAHFKKPAL